MTRRCAATTRLACGALRENNTNLDQTGVTFILISKPLFSLQTSTGEGEPGFIHCVGVAPDINMVTARWKVSVSSVLNSCLYFLTLCILGPIEQVETNRNYDYVDVTRFVVQDSLQFQVQANNDAHVLLVGGQREFEIVIGGWANSKSMDRVVLRQRTEIPIFQQYNSNTLLSV